MKIGLNGYYYLITQSNGSKIHPPASTTGRRVVSLDGTNKIATSDMNYSSCVLQ